MATTPGTPCWIDLMTSDVERSRAFYCALFGWSAGEPSPDFGGYFMFSSRDGAVVAGGMGSEPGSGMPEMWSLYLATDDAGKTVESTETRGGQVHVAPMAVADLGTMGMLGDVGGAAVGIWQPGQFAGFEVRPLPDTPTYFELHTRDYAASVAFYHEVFGVETLVVSDDDSFRYTQLVVNGAPVAGIMDITSFPGEAPAQWAVYFGVTDTDASLARVVELGGTVLQPAEDTPYGRLALAADPLGATFRLVAPNEAMPAKG